MRILHRMIIFFAFLGTLWAWQTPQATADQPNIVFIISDDHDYEHLGFMGNETA